MDIGSFDACKRAARSLVIAALAIFTLGACRAHTTTAQLPNEAYTLQPCRTSGSWKAPPSRAERKRLNQVIHEDFVNIERCAWRYGKTISNSEIGSSLKGTIGVDARGHVVWLELDPPEAFALRECLSKELADLRFDPPPTEQVMLVFTLPQYD